MAKAASPVRLQEELMQAATLAGAQMHRSAAEQIEYWASLGRRVGRVLDPEVLLEVAAGLARLKVEPVTAVPLDPDVVFAAVEADRRSGEATRKVTTAAIRYQASVTHPGYLEQIDANGVRSIGTFQNGIFTPMSGDAD